MASVHNTRYQHDDTNFLIPPRSTCPQFWGRSWEGVAFLKLGLVLPSPSTLLRYTVDLDSRTHVKNVQTLGVVWGRVGGKLREIPDPETARSDLGGGGGLWCDTPAVNLEPPLVRWHHCVLNKRGDSHPRGQSLLRYQPVCL